MTKDQIMNQAVDLSLEWGENWLQPILTKLADKYPSLSSAELADYNEKSHEVTNTGFNIIGTALESVKVKKTTIKESDLKTIFDKEMIMLYPWINTSNLKKLFSQGLYYSWKEGLNDCIK